MPQRAGVRGRLQAVPGMEALVPRGLAGDTGGQRVIETILAEMGRGNFSFLILVVGVAQLGAMLWRRKHD